MSKITDKHLVMLREIKEHNQWSWVKAAEMVCGKTETTIWRWLRNNDVQSAGSKAPIKYIHSLIFGEQN